MRKSIIVALAVTLSAAFVAAGAARAEPATMSVKKTGKKKHATVHRDMVTMKRGTGSTARRRTTIPSGSLVEPRPTLQTNPPAAIGTPRPGGAGRSP